MELKDFVAQTLCQICEGIKEAQNSVSTSGAIISPICEYHTNNGGYVVCPNQKTGNSVPAEVHYDVAVTASDYQEGGESGKKALSLQVVSAKLALGCDNGKSEKHSHSNESVSHVAFSVRVLWPEPSTCDQ